MILATLSNACIASRKFVRNEVKTSSDTLNTRIETGEAKTAGEISEVRDGVSRVDARVTTVDGRVTQLDSKTNERFDGVRNEVSAVDKKAATAQSAADRVAGNLTTLDENFQNRNHYSVAAEKAILFPFDSSKLDTKYQTELEEIVTLLQGNPNALLVMEGRTDSSGDQDYNVRLGERRVEAVKRFIAVEKGIPVYRIHEISFGAAKPVAANDSREGREKNRAVMLTVLVPRASSTVAKNPNQ
jgi:outer membrane protein OmpA-like peptidoglycan-associated protein